MEAITISLIDQKGGCGKSSCCFHLAGYLSSVGLNVLLIDADPQGSLSQGFFGSAEVETLTIDQTLAGLFWDAGANVKSLPVLTPIERIAIVRSNQLLARYNKPSPEEYGMEQQTLAVFLEEIAELELFDFVLIDCPPNLYQCSWNALIAADFVVVRVPPEDFGTQGLRVVHQAIENAKALNPKLQLLGHLITRFDKRLLLHQSYERKLRELYGHSVFSTTITETSAFKVALACRKPVTQYSPRTKAAEQVGQFANEMFQRIHRQIENREVA